uniref:Reverse transcriptase domain-containing protein n=1 Tax=Tanacetum cinerariifolium TaxID=118510 RepID=A0A6L2NR92_TANCI|nr:reverse transcriptase domain-containing protein [Tanacetum cinerariifolium]
MHNNIMAAGSRDHLPMLATRRYAQWRSRFLRYIDTRPNGDALRKCILNGPYTSTIVVIQVVAATHDSPEVPEHTTVETPLNMSPENKARCESEKKAIQLILTGIGDEIYSTVDASKQLKKCRKPSKGYNKPLWSRFVTIVKQQHKLDEVSYHKLFDILKQYQKEINELRAERIAMIYKPTNNNLRTSLNSRNKNVDTTPRYKNDNQSGQFGSQRTMNVVGARDNVGSPVVQQSGIQCFNCKEFGHFAKECRNPKRVKDSSYHKEKMLLCKQAEKGVPLQAAKSDWLADTDEEINEQELEAPYSYMVKIHEVPTADSDTDFEPLEQTEFEKYKSFNDRAVDYEKLERKLNETLGLLAQKDIDIKEGLKLKAYEISIVKEKHDENLFPPLDNPELTIRRRSRTDPTLLNNSEMAVEGNGDLPVPDLRTMEELCQVSLNGRGGPIAPIAIQATNFGLKNDMIQKVQNSCQFHGLGGDDANKHLDKFLHVTQSIKVNGVTDDALCLYLFPHSLTHHATAWFDRLLRNSINTFEQMAKIFLGKYFPPSMVTKLKNEITNFRQRPDESLFEAWERSKLSIDRFPNHNMLPVTQIDIFYNGLTLRHRDTINAAAGGTFMKRRPEECYDLIDNMTAHHNDWDNSAQRSESSSSITSFSDTKIAALKAEMAEINKNLIRVLQVNQQAKAVTPSCETCGGPHSFNDLPATNSNTQNVYATGAYQAYQAPVYQAPVHQPQIPQPQVVTTNEFTNFMKATDAILKNMQTNMTYLTNSKLELKNMFSQFMKMNTASSSGSGTLPGNTITNPKEDLKGITTRSGTAYQGPTIPTTTTSSSSVVECETEATKDMVHPTNNESTEDVQPPVVLTESSILNSEPVFSPVIESPVSAPKPNQRPSNLNFNTSSVDALILMPKFGPSIKSLLTKKDKLCELARTPLNEHCSAVLLKKLPEKLEDPGKFLIPCDFPGMAECLALADLGASINLMPLYVWNKLSLPDLSPTCMTLELVDRLISRPVGVAEDVFVKVGTFYFPADFVVVDFDADPRVPLILGRSFLKTRRDLIDVFEGELTLRVGKEAITFNLDQTSRYSANYNDMIANRIDVVDMACEEYSQEVLSFSNVIASGNPTPYYDSIVSTTSPTLTPFGNSDFLLEEVDAFLSLEDDLTSSEVDQSYVNTEEDILLLEAFLNDDPSLPPPNQRNYLPQVRKELKICEAKIDKSSIDEPAEVKVKDLPPHLEYAFLEGNDKLPVIIAKYLSVEEKTALITEDFKPAVQHQRRVNPKIHDVIKNEGGFIVLKTKENELILTRLVMGWRACIDYHKLNEATRKNHFPLPFMDQMLERLAGNQYYCFLDGFSGYFQIPIDSKDQEKTTFCNAPLRKEDVMS